jgi:hypothetical protein
VVVSAAADVVTNVGTAVVSTAESVVIVSAAADVVTNVGTAVVSTAVVSPLVISSPRS